MTTSGVRPSRSRSWSRLVTVTPVLTVPPSSVSSPIIAFEIDCGAALGHGPAGAVTGRGQHQSDRAAERGVQPAERMRGDAHVQSLGRLVVPAPGRPGGRQQRVQPEPGERQRMLRQVHDRAEDVVEQVVEAPRSVARTVVSTTGRRRRSEASVTCRSRDRTPARPSSSGCTRSSSGHSHSSPNRSSPSVDRNGETTPVGWKAAQSSWSSPGRVSSDVRVPPPGRS